MPAELRGQISLVLTSPPHGRTMHGRVEHRRGPLTRFHNTYSHKTPGEVDPAAANLAHRGRAALIDGITAVLAGCIPLLKSDGLIVVVARPWRRDHFLVDLPGQTIQAGQAAGLHLLASRRAVHAAVRDGQLVPHHTFWQLSVARASRRKGMPVSLIQHDDIAVFTASPSSGSSCEAVCSPAGRKPCSWPEDGESRYPPAPLRSRRPVTASHKTTEADDHHDQHQDPGTGRSGSPVGRAR